MSSNTAKKNSFIHLMGLVVFLLTAGAGHTAIEAAPIIFKNITVIDGLGNQPQRQRDVLIANGRIAQISDHAIEPGDMKVIDGSGMTMMPGLIDLHTHLGRTHFPLERGKKKDVEDISEALRALLYAGVTTTMDLGNQHDLIVKARDLAKEGNLAGPRMIVTGATFQRLHSIDDVRELPTKGQKEIEERLDRYEADGINIIKLYTGMSPWSARHLMKEARRRSMRGIADFWCTNLSQDIFIVAELNAYAHGSCTELEDKEAQWMAENSKFAMMTLTIFDTMGGHRQLADYETKGFLETPLIVDVLGEETVSQYYETFQEVRDAFFDTPESLYQSQYFPELKPLLGINFTNLKKLHSAGVLLGMGTDGNFPPGNFFGDSMHREMELHVEAGLTPLQTIKIATYNGAKILELDKEIGSVEEGKLADLLIVKGDPSTDINDTRNIEYVLQSGRVIDRESLKFTQ